MTEPTKVTMAGAKAGYNGSLTVKGYGSANVRVERILYGMAVISHEAVAANRKVYYPNKVVSNSFGMALIFAKWSEREAFSKWVSDYMKKVTTGQIANGSMLVSVPGRKFARSAVPSGTLEFGDDITQSGRAYRLTLNFIGATRPMLAKDTSRFRNSTNKILATFYPGGTQKAGAESLAGTLFDTAAPVPFGPNPNKRAGIQGE